MDLTTIIAYAVTFIFGVGGIWVGYIIKAAKAGKEIGELLSVAGAALEDKKLTPEEIASILKEFNDIKEVIAAFRTSAKK